MSNQLYYSSFIPVSATETLPKPVMSYRSEESLKLDHEQLMNESQKLTLEVTAKQVAALEAETRKQSNSKLFYSCSYGCNHESIARKKYNSVMCQQHEAFSISDSGLRVNLK